MEKLYDKALQIISDAKHIVVLQADNPDGDSLASALALEAILEDQGKKVTLVSGIDMPVHLHYLEGWSRVEKELPKQFDASILVDASTTTLLESLDKSGQLAWVRTKPLLVLDHHATTEGIAYATVTINAEVVSTGELIYNLATYAKFKMPIEALNAITVSILSDSLGLTTEATSVQSIRVVADLVEAGVSLSSLDNARRELMKREPVLLAYKGKLLQRVELLNENKIAVVSIPWEEIEAYSSLYNPPMLIMDDMRMTVGVQVAIAFKIYNNGRVTAKIRCNSGFPIAGKLAESFGGGGHDYAAGFKKNNITDFADLKAKVILRANELLQENIK